MQDIPIGEIGYQFLCEFEGDYFSCKVETNILEQHVAFYPLLEEIVGKKKIFNVGCWITGNTTIVWDRYRNGPSYVIQTQKR